MKLVLLLAVSLLLAFSVAQETETEDLELEHGRSGACCKPDGSCRRRSERRCERSGGVFLGRHTSCESNSSQCPGACCLTDRCDWVNEDECDGVYRGNETTCDFDCNGACCEDSVCNNKQQFDCVGRFHSIGTHCLPDNQCPQLDAILVVILLFAVLFFIYICILGVFVFRRNTRSGQEGVNYQFVGAKEGEEGSGTSGAVIVCGIVFFVLFIAVILVLFAWAF